MTEKKEPVRMCVACRLKKPRSELVRVVRAVDGEILPDVTGKMDGRGAYMCMDTRCIGLAEKKQALSRAFKCKVDAGIYEELRNVAERHGK